MPKDPAPFDEGVFLMRYHKGKEYFDQNRLPAALEELEAAHHLRPQDEKVRNLLGMTYFKLDMLPQAEEMYIQLAANNPDIYTLHNNLGLIRLKLDKLDEAEESLKHALQVQPSNPKTHFYLGLLCEKRELWEEGLRHFEAAQAEKMVAKMRARIEEEHRQNEVLLPFEVLSVLDPEVTAAEGDFSTSDTDETTQPETEDAVVGEESGIVIFSEEEGESPSEPKKEETTNRMIRPQAVQEVRVQYAEESSSPDAAESEADVEAEAEPFPQASGSTNTKQAQRTPAVDWQQFLQAPDALKLDEVLQNLKKAEAKQGADDAEPQIESEEAVVEAHPLEKTEPEIFPDEIGKKEHESVQEESEPQVDRAPTIPIEPIESPLFLTEGMEADISTFLAQSREEERKREKEEEQYSQQSPFGFQVMPGWSTPESKDSNEEEEAKVGEEPFGERIPSPEEVEQEVASLPEVNEGTEAEMIASSPELEYEEAHSESEFVSESEAIPEMNEKPEDSYSSWDGKDIQEEAREEAPAAANLEEESGLEEDVEVEELLEDDAVSNEQEEIAFETIGETDSEDEDEQDSDDEGHLEPSPLTPQFIEHMELTQDMSSALYAEQEVIPDSTEFAAEADSSEEIEAILSDEEEAPAISEEPESEEVAEEQPNLAEDVSAHEDTLEPAKIDPFSRDRFYFQPLLGADRFLLMDPHLLEVVLSEDLICRIGTISSYTGDLQFAPWTSKSTMNLPLVQVKGNGVLFLADQQKEIFLFSLNREVLFVESNHLLVAQSALNVEPCVFHHASVEERISAMKVSGRGTLALTCETKPLAINIQPERPASIPAHAIVAWSGELKADVQQDEQLQKIMGPSQNTLFLRFTGRGDVVVEQGSLWKDPRHQARQ